MARYRLKSQEELAWNVIRRAAMAEVHLRALAWKEARLNEVLPALQVEFHKMLQKGELPQLEADYKEWLDSAFAAMQNRELEDPTDAANGGS